MIIPQDVTITFAISHPFPEYNLQKFLRRFMKSDCKW